MLKLSFNGSSPYVRRISIMINLLDIADKVELVDCIPYTDQEYRQRNPGGLVPSLQVSETRHIHDSVAIGFFLEEEFGPASFMSAFSEGDYDRLSLYGEIEAAQQAMVKLRQDSMRGEDRPVDWYINRYQETILAVTKSIEKKIDALDELDFVSISLICALGAIDLRNPDVDWRSGCPRLVAWLDGHNDNNLIGDTHPKLTA